MATLVSRGGPRRKKKKPARLSRKYDTKFLGDEPKWDIAPVDENERAERKRNAIRWYTYFSGPGDFPEEVKSLAEHLKLETKYMPEYRWAVFGTTAAFMSRMWTKGFVLNDEEKTLFTENVNSANARVIEAEKTKPTTRERVEVKKYSRHIMDLDAVEDCWILNKEAPVINFSQANLTYRENLKEVQTEIKNWCDGRIKEYELFLANDKDVREGYPKLDVKTAKNRIQWMKDVLQQLMDVFKRPEKERKPRKVKIIPPEKLIRGFKFLDKYENFTSVDPKTIIGSRAVILYNPTGRFFALVEAEENNVLSVKGSLIINTKSCRVTKLRKPEIFVPSVMTSTLKHVQVNLEQLTTKIVDGKPKSNGDTLVLRVFR